MTGTNRSKQVIASITQAGREAQEKQEKPIAPDAARAKEDRTWEKKHKSTPIRLEEKDVDWLRAFAASQSVPIDVAGRGLVRAIREAVEQGLVTFRIEQEVERYQDTIGRTRQRVRVELEPHWEISQRGG